MKHPNIRYDLGARYHKKYHYIVQRRPQTLEVSESNPTIVYIVSI